jgi:DNA modification methylase
MGSMYRSQHELVFVLKSGRESHINNVDLGRHGRYRTNVWNYAGANTFSVPRVTKTWRCTPTVKPVALISDAILDASHPKGIILDPFAGSGSTLVAAEKTRRTGADIEIDPTYCDVILRRLTKVTGSKPTLQPSRKSFDAVAEKRLNMRVTDGGGQ